MRVRPAAQSREDLGTDKRQESDHEPQKRNDDVAIYHPKRTLPMMFE